MNKFKLIIPIVILGLLPLTSANASFISPTLLSWFMQEIMGADTPPPPPKKPEGPDFSNPAVLEEYMSQLYNVRWIDAKNIGETDEYGFGDCGYNFEDTKVHSNEVGYFGQYAGEIEVYGYRNVLISYYYNGENWNGYGKLIGSKLVTGLPVHLKETVEIRIADEVGDIWDNKVSDLIKIQCSNSYIDEPTQPQHNMQYSYNSDFLVIPVLEDIENDVRYYATFLPQEGNLRLVDLVEIKEAAGQEVTAKLYGETGRLLIPEIVTPMGNEFRVYRTSDGWIFKDVTATSVEVVDEDSNDDEPTNVVISDDNGDEGGAVFTSIN